MKYVLILLITLSACHVNKENTQNQDINRLHDIWALHSIKGELYTNGMAAKHPTLEIFVADKRVGGTDGCNQIGGSIKTITETDLTFGPLMGTKMMCQKMEVADAFGRELGKTNYYTLKDLKLTLLDEDRNELMVFRKVD